MDLDEQTKRFVVSAFAERNELDLPALPLVFTLVLSLSQGKDLSKAIEELEKSHGGDACKLDSLDEASVWVKKNREKLGLE